ncbi:winged helix-turn-helix domain-containing protein [Paenibacillus sp. MABNR03]|uniref:winged helix-turn-helix domain-containing protein n=1 Tax=Paenibacillus sp. MABNR03 TaxID=3142626 RepID=UPI003D2D6DFB
MQHTAVQQEGIGNEKHGPMAWQRFETGRVNKMKTSILLIGVKERTNEIKEVLCAEGYTVLDSTWEDLYREQEFQLTTCSMVIRVMEENHDHKIGEELHCLLEQKEGSVPIIVITSPIPPEQVVAWLDQGVNDVIVEPIQWKVMMARIRNLLRVFANAVQMDEEVIVVHDLKVNLRSRRVSRAGEYLMLTPKEYELLEFLARHVNEACTRSVILREVWGYDFAMDTNVVDVYIKHLRVKVDKGRDIKLIQTVRGIGYMLHTDS